MATNKRKTAQNTGEILTVKKALLRGSLFTRLSFLFMGFGQTARGQWLKGLLYALLQLGFSLFFIFFGGRYIAQLFSGKLGTKVAGEQWFEQLHIFE